jgi:hypothetical protein
MLASISTFIFEKPIIARASNKSIVLILFFYLLTILLVFLQVSNSSHLNSRKASQIQENYAGEIGHKKFYGYLEKNFSHCGPISLYENASTYAGRSRCYQSKAGVRDVALIGDSHAEHIFPGLSRKFSNLNFVYYLTNSNYSVNNPENFKVSQVILEDPNIKFVVINSWWFAKRINPKMVTEYIELFTRAGKKVFVFNDVPDFNFDPLACKFTRPYINFSICSQKLSNDYYAKIRLLNSVVDNRKGSFFIDTFENFCNFERTSCSMKKNEKIFYRDYNHLNIEGSIFFASMIEDKIFLSAE